MLNFQSDITRCLVMILEILPETWTVEIICPEEEANLLVEIKKSELIILSIVLVILSILL